MAVPVSPWFLATPLVAAALLWAMGFALLLFRCPSKANRPFSAYLFLQGGVLAANALHRWDGSGPPGFWVHVYTDMQLLLVPVLVYFALQYARPLRGTPLTVVSALVLAAGAAIELMHVRDACLALCAGPTGAVAGPFFLLDYASPLWLAGIGLALIAAARRYGQAKRTAICLVAGGLALVALLDGLLATTNAFQQGAFEVSGLSGGWATAAAALRALAMLPALGCIVAIVLLSPATDLRRRAVVAAGAVLAVVATVLVVASNPTEEPGAMSYGVFFANLWSVLYSGLIAFALLRHRLFGLDQVVKVTLSRSTIAALFLAVFLVISKITENVVGSQFQGPAGPIVGGVAVGLLLFALHPLQRLGERVADTVIPGERGGRTMGAKEKLRIYKEQAELVWSDGLMGPQERSLLESLRSRLGIPPEEALRLEHEAAKSHGRPAASAARKQPA